MVSYGIRDFILEAHPMLMKIKASLNAFRESIANLGRNRSALSAEEQTRLSWARTAKSDAEVPEIYRSFYDVLGAEKREPFPYTVITPTYKGFLTPENEKLVCRVDQNIFVLEKIDGRLVSICYPLDGIFRIETGTILLSSWLTINGLDPDGVPNATTLRFNSVTEPLLAAFVDGFRTAIAGPAADETAAPDLSVFDSLEELHFKFMNYGRKTLRAGEKVVQTVLQPELRNIFFRLFGFMLSRQITPTHLAILTDSEFILIRDDDSRHWRKEHPYGGIWNYVPLKKISSVSLSQTEEDILILTIRLPKKVRLDALYQVSLRAEVMKLQQRIKTGMTG